MALYDWRLISPPNWAFSFNQIAEGGRTTDDLEDTFGTLLGVAKDLAELDKIAQLLTESDFKVFAARVDELALLPALRNWEAEGKGAQEVARGRVLDLEAKIL